MQKSSAVSENATSRRLIDTSSKNVLREYPVNKNVEASSPDSVESVIKYLPDGRRFVTANGKSLYIWDISDVVTDVEDSEAHEKQVGKAH